MAKKFKTVTVKVKSTESATTEYTEYEFPVINSYLDEGWVLVSTDYNTTSVNVGFLYITFIICKDKD